MSKDLNNRWACLLAIVLATCSSHALGAGDYMRPANEGEPAMRGSGENRGGFFFFARACLLRCRSRLRPRSRLVPRAVLSSSRFSPRLACRRAGRCRSRRSLLRCPRLCPVVIVSPVRLVLLAVGRGGVRLVPWACSSCVRGVVVLVSSPVPCLLVVGRGGVCVDSVDCPIHIYDLSVSWYLIGVEREQTPTERKSRNDDQDQHPHHQLPFLRDRV